MQVTPLRPLALLALLTGCLSASAAERAAAQTRAPTAEEQKSFDEFYSQAHPGDKPVRTLFEVRREAGSRGWTVSAAAEAAPGRGPPREAARLGPHGDPRVRDGRQ